MDIISDREIDRLEREAQKQERETYGICPIMGVGGHQCNSGCEWYIKDQGCAISVIAKNIGYGGEVTRTIDMELQGIKRISDIEIHDRITALETQIASQKVNI